MAIPSQTILIVGGTAGIGLTAAEAISRRGTVLSRKVNIVTFGLGEVNTIKLEDELHADTVLKLYGDVTDEAQRRDVVRQTEENFGGIDTLVYCAGVITPIVRLQDLDIGEVKKTFDVNVFGAMAMVQLCLPHLRKSRFNNPLNTGYGKVIIMSSACDSDIMYHGWTPYCTSKAALTRFISCLAHEEPLISVQGVYPKLTRTAMVKGIFEDRYEGVMANHEIEKFKTWEEYNGESESIEPPEWCAEGVSDLALGLAEGKKSGEMGFYDEHIPWEIRKKYLKSLL
ncbi:NAD(P)-binding protein [Plenodomus tracheiphilus IPT5]|uniref:NAD(P)-binding protein n=1 Tax=Plenodomus tracheiphilus IPT5 TaxID=1408161 RepID=A0A6A7AR28_9PLEO|nr:NAD(P)-binding protein [Plenodomus tracheiphilus IPT5]